MVNHKKRNLSLLAAAFSFVCSVGLIVINGVLLASKFLSKEGEKTIIEKIGLPSIYRNYMAKLSEQDMSTFVLATVALLAIGILLFICSVKIVKMPVKKNGCFTYRKGTILLVLLFEVVVVFVGYKGYTTKEIVGVRTLKFFCYFYLISGGVSALFALFSFFFKGKDFQLAANDSMVLLQGALSSKGKGLKPSKYKANALDYTSGYTANKIDSYKGKKGGNVYYNTYTTAVPGVVTGNVEERLYRMRQLLEAGVITETQYNAAVVRLLNGL